MNTTIEHIDQPVKIELSDNTKALIALLKEIKPHQQGLIGDEYHVSQTVSFFGFIYEKLRNSVEFNEEHLIRRLAIVRILKRRLQINPDGNGEGENIIRELLWGKYILQQSITQNDVKNIQIVIERYIYLKKEIYKIHLKTNKRQLYLLILDLLSCEIEEMINWEQIQRKSTYMYFFYHTLKDKILLKKSSDDLKDKLFYVATEKAYLKNDDAFIKYHLFTLLYDRLINISNDKIPVIAKEFGSYTQILSQCLKNRYNELLVKFAKKQLPPFKILSSILEEYRDTAEKILTNGNELRRTVDEICSAKYKETAIKLRNAAVRSITYIFLTKMIFVIILELPLTRYIYGHIEIIPLMVNTLFPPLLMGIIVFFINPPSDNNTQKIYHRIVDILNKDTSFEKEKVEIKERFQMRNPSLLFVFTFLYIITFNFVFGSIYSFLNLLGYTFISKIVFLFFLCVVAFFGYRIRQTAKEYVIESKNNILMNFFTFLFLPILFVGKILSSQISRVNILIIIFDSLIEAPFKFFIEVIEEWTRFIKARKDELI